MRFRVKWRHGTEYAYRKTHNGIVSAADKLRVRENRYRSEKLEWAVVQIQGNSGPWQPYGVIKNIDNLGVRIFVGRTFVDALHVAMTDNRLPRSLSFGKLLRDGEVRTSKCGLCNILVGFVIGGIASQVKRTDHKQDYVYRANPYISPVTQAMEELGFNRRLEAACGAS
jgi:hypothetical protein